MAGKTDTEVIIGGKVYTLSGYESEEYLQRVASYINNKLAEYGSVDSFKRLPIDIQTVLLQINIADDYFKARRQITMLEEDIASKEKNIYDLKHELVAAKMKLDNNDKTLKALQAKLGENEKELVRMETQLKGQKGNQDPHSQGNRNNGPGKIPGNGDKNQNFSHKQNSGQGHGPGDNK